MKIKNSKTRSQSIVVLMLFLVVVMLGLLMFTTSSSSGPEETVVHKVHVEKNVWLYVVKSAQIERDLYTYFIVDKEPDDNVVLNVLRFLRPIMVSDRDDAIFVGNGATLEISTTGEVLAFNSMGEVHGSYGKIFSEIKLYIHKPEAMEN